MTSWRRRPCQTSLPNRSPAPTPGAAGHAQAASSSAPGGRRCSPWVHATPERTSSSSRSAPPTSSLSYMAFPQQNPQSPSASLFSHMPYPLSTSSTCQAAEWGSLSTTVLNFLISLLFYVLFFWPLEACGILASRPGSKPTPLPTRKAAGPQRKPFYHF